MAHPRNAFLPILAILAGPVFGAQWADVSTGLTGPAAHVSALTISADGSTLYARTWGNNIYRSSDAGASWKWLGGVSGLLVIAPSPGSASVLYAGTNHGVFKSVDSGDSWAPAGLAGKSVFALAIDPITPSTLYAGVSGQSYKSSDGGATWSVLSLPRPAQDYAVYSITIDPLTPSTLYALGSGAPGPALYKSTDAGETWGVIDPGPFWSSLVIDPSNPSTLYAMHGREGLSKSTDGGATWASLGFDQAEPALAIDPANSNILYALTSGPALTNQAVMKSTDGGRHWSTVNTSISVVGASLVISPHNTSTVYLGGYAGVYKSTDGGANFVAGNSGLRVFNIGVLVPHPTDPTIVYAGGDGGLFRSIDSGESWTQWATFQVTAGVLPPGQPPPAAPIPGAASTAVGSLVIDYSNPNILYAWTFRTDGCFFSDILLYKSTDGGSTWDNISPKQSGCQAAGLLAMDPADPQTLYLRYGDFYDGYGVLKTTDGGGAWRGIGGGGNVVNTLIIDPENPALLYAATDIGIIMSNDGAAHWSKSGLEQTDVMVLAMDPVQSNVLYAATSAGLFKSMDSAATWSRTGAGLPNSVTGLTPAGKGLLYASTSDSGVFKSRDGGATWAPFNDGLTQVNVLSLAVVRQPSLTIYAGTPFGIFRIVDNEPLAGPNRGKPRR